MALKRSELKPGMQVRNTVTGSTGEIRADHDDSSQVMFSAEWCVPIRRRNASGKLQGKWTYPYWQVENLELLK